VFRCWEVTLSNSVIVLFVSVIVSMEINMRRYFRSNLQLLCRSVSETELLSLIASFYHINRATRKWMKCKANQEIMLDHKIWICWIEIKYSQCQDVSLFLCSFLFMFIINIYLQDEKSQFWFHIPQGKMQFYWFVEMEKPQIFTSRTACYSYFKVLKV